MDLSRLVGRKVWAWVWLKAYRLLQMEGFGWMPPFLKGWTCLDQAGARFGLAWLCFCFEMSSVFLVVEPSKLIFPI